MNIPPILKNKWVWIGGAVVIIIVMAASGGGSASVSTASGPSDAEVAANRDITLAQMQQQAAQNAANTQLAIATQQGNIDLAGRTMEAQLAQYALDNQLAVQSLQANTARDIQMADIQSSERQNIAAINSQMQIAKMTLDQQTMNTQLNTEFQLQYAEAANATQVSLAQMQAQLVSNQVAANRDVTMAGLATQEQLAAINAALQRDVTYSTNATMQAVMASSAAAETERLRITETQRTEQMRIQGSAQKKSAKYGMIGSIAGAIGSIFSEPALKKNIKVVGQRPDGLNIYAFDYIDETGAYGMNNHLGVMADEVQKLRPDALGPNILGLRMVDYYRL